MISDLLKSDITQIIPFLQLITLRKKLREIVLALTPKLPGDCEIEAKIICDFVKLRPKTTFAFVKLRPKITWAFVKLSPSFALWYADRATLASSLA